MKMNYVLKWRWNAEGEKASVLAFRWKLSPNLGYVQYWFGYERRPLRGCLKAGRQESYQKRLDQLLRILASARQQRRSVAAAQVIERSAAGWPFKHPRELSIESRTSILFLWDVTKKKGTYFRPGSGIFPNLRTHISHKNKVKEINSVPFHHNSIT